MRHLQDSQTLVRAFMEAREWLLCSKAFLSNGNLDDAAAANILATLHFSSDYSQFDQGESPVTAAIRKPKQMPKGDFVAAAGKYFSLLLQCRHDLGFRNQIKAGSSRTLKVIISS